MKVAWKKIALGSDKLLAEIQPGYACGNKDVLGGVVHLRMNNVTRDGAFDSTLLRRIPKNIALKQGKFLEKNDVIFVNTNSTELVGKSMVFPGLQEACTFSNHLTRIRPNPEKLHPIWMHLCFRKLWHEGFFAANCIEFIGQSTFNTNQLRALEIPVPPLPEQRRIVARIEALTSRAEELRGMNSSVIDDFHRMLGLEYSRLAKKASLIPFGKVAQLIRRPVDPRSMEDFPEVGIRSFGKGTFHKPALSRAQLGNKRVFRVQSGDLVFMNVFAWEGAIAVAKPEDEDRVASHRFMTHVVDQKQATPEFLCHHFLTEHGLEQIRGASPGSAGRNRTLGITKLHAINVPVPPVREQQRFSAMVKKLNELRRLQEETEAELAAFTPALLEKAFRGEL